MTTLAAPFNSFRRSDSLRQRTQSFVEREDWSSESESDDYIGHQHGSGILRRSPSVLSGAVNADDSDDDAGDADEGLRDYSEDDDQDLPQQDS